MNCPTYESIIRKTAHLRLSVEEDWRQHMLECDRCLKAFLYARQRKVETILEALGE